MVVRQESGDQDSWDSDADGIVRMEEGNRTLRRLMAIAFSYLALEQP
jgi:hypothetical protein